MELFSFNSSPSLKCASENKETVRSKLVKRVAADTSVAPLRMSVVNCAGKIVLAVLSTSAYQTDKIAALIRGTETLSSRMKDQGKTASKLSIIPVQRYQ
ncbi:hypothetical protein CEXT_176991 [Caerostris extrusa]|uniref:IclR-ED domain-containing protein n=1 Tax=Caerostris extrusa TaxID=172846 RepID=A0AAV4UXU3_CAEEX|nr:hypothetical protein CEXT_176991 [Caerostris extrusa]